MENVRKLYDLHLEVANLIAEAVTNGSFEWKLKNKNYHSGYVDIALSIDSMIMEVSVNIRGYVCWHDALSKAELECLRNFHPDTELTLAVAVIGSIINDYFASEGGDNE